MAAETDKFVIASFALWAGDFEFFEELLKEYSPPHETPPLNNERQSPEGVIRAIGALRLRQLRQKKGEFRKIKSDYDNQGVEIVTQPLTHETVHLRGTIWRTNLREFVMQAYLKDLSWQDELFRRAHEQMIEQGKASPEVSDSRGLAADSNAVGPIGTSWTIVGSPFVEVELSDLGLLEIRVLWTRPRLPTDVADLSKPFLQVLRTLDELASQ